MHQLGEDGRFLTESLMCRQSFVFPMRFTFFVISPSYDMETQRGQTFCEWIIQPFVQSFFDILHIRRGRGGKEKEWTDCVQSDIRIAGDWKATALKAEVWVETVTEGGRRFMAAAWRKEEVDAARHRQEKREATRLGNLLSQTGV